MTLQIKPWPKDQKSFYNKHFFQTLGEEGFYMFLVIFEGADFKFNCYKSCTPTDFSQFKEYKNNTASPPSLVYFGHECSNYFRSLFHGMSFKIIQLRRKVGKCCLRNYTSTEVKT